MFTSFLVLKVFHIVNSRAFTAPRNFVTYTVYSTLHIVPQLRRVTCHSFMKPGGMLANELSRIGAITQRPVSSAPPSAAAASPTMVHGRKQVIHVKDVDKAKKALDDIWSDPPANAPSIDQDGDASWGPVVLCEATTWKDFERWLNVNEGRVRRWVFEPLADGTGQGRVVIYSMPSFIHDKTAGEISRSIVEQIQTHGNSIPLIRTVEWAATPRCWTGDRGQEPDFGLTPVGLTVGGAVLEAANGCPFPNVIVEVAYKNDDLASLRAKLVRWMAQTSVQVAIGIKIYAGGATPLRRVAILHQRGQPVQEVEFGLDGQRTPPLTISFPVAAVYVGVALPAALAGLNNPQISIDLIALRALIEANIQLDDASRAAAAQAAAQ